MNLRFMERKHLQRLDVNRGHEPTPNPSEEGSRTSCPAQQFPSWEGPGVGRFMESEHLQSFDVSWGHESVGIPLNRPAGTFSPNGGEGWDEGVRFM